MLNNSQKQSTPPGATKLEALKEGYPRVHSGIACNAAQVEILLEYAAAHENGRLLPYVALLLGPWGMTRPRQRHVGTHWLDGKWASHKAFRRAAAMSHFTSPMSKTDVSLWMGHTVVPYYKPVTAIPFSKARMPLRRLLQFWLGLTRREQAELRLVLRSYPLSEPFVSVIEIDVAADDPKAWE